MLPCIIGQMLNFNKYMLINKDANTQNIAIVIFLNAFTLVIFNNDNLLISCRIVPEFVSLLLPFLYK